MYIPGPYKNSNIEEVKEFIRLNGFGILVSHTGSKLWATHIPLELEKNEKGEDVLYGHISKANPQWKNIINSEVLVIFQGPHSYISSSWYDHMNVSTWNYIAVHVYGSIRIIEGRVLMEVLKKLTEKYEKNSTTPATLNKMPADFLKKEMKGIVGFEILINEIQAAYKLSQNRDDKNYNNIVSQLEKRPDHGSQCIASEMKKRKKKRMQ